MTEEESIKVFEAFLEQKAAKLDRPLARVPIPAERLSRGWAFYYQSRAYIETGKFAEQLVGQGPVVIRDDGKIIEGGSLDRDPEALLNR